MNIKYERYFESLKAQMRKYEGRSQMKELTYENLKLYMCNDPESRNVGRYKEGEGFVALSGIEGKIKPPVFITTIDGYTLAISETDLRRIESGRIREKRRSGTLQFD